MKIVVISGSARASSQSRKVADYLHGVLESKGVSCVVLDLHELQLPSFDPDQPDPMQLAVTLELLQEADGFVMISPEWGGMVNHRIISFLHYVDQQMSDKPLMVVGISSSRGGHYPVEQMRMMGAKNKHYVIIPEHLVITDVKNVMNTRDVNDENDGTYIKKRATYALDTLLEYAKALRSIRESGVIDHETYPNGM